jgi:ferredoxin
MEPQMEIEHERPSVLVVGEGGAAQSCLTALGHLGILTTHLSQLPSRIWHGKGRYVALSNGKTLEGTGVVFAPRNLGELNQLFTAADSIGPAPSQDGTNPPFELRQPGIFLCDPNTDTNTAGSAAAARVAAWLGRLENRASKDVAVVSLHRCRACNTCVETCEIGAPVLHSEKSRRYAWIDPAICTGCGSCVGQCPSDAIRIGCTTDEQLVARMDAVLGF